MWHENECRTNIKRRQRWPQQPFPHCILHHPSFSSDALSAGACSFGSQAHRPVTQSCTRVRWISFSWPLFWIFSLSLSLLLQWHNFASVDSVVRWDLQARPPPPLRGHGRRRGGGGGAIPPAEEAAADDDDGSQADATAGADGFRPGGGARAVLPLCW